MKKKKDRDAEIPSAGMSDIVFLLLLFFLVSTTIDVDTGIGLTLPEYVPIEEQVFVPLSKDRLAALNINENGDVGVCYRSGRPGSSGACGALIAFREEMLDGEDLPTAPHKLIEYAA